MRSCVECQYRNIKDTDQEGNSVGEDCFHIRCEHPKQEDTEGFTAKMKNMYGKVYFSCPDIGWKDRAYQFLKELQSNEDYEYDSTLQSLIDEF